MKLGVFGAGMIINDFLSMYKQVDDLELMYICATASEEDRLKELCGKYDIPKYYLDVDEAFADESCDTCYIGVPNYLHYNFASKALDHNKDIILEKPFTSNYREAVSLAEKAREKKLMLVEGVSTHYFPNMQKIKEALPSLGDIKLVMMNFSKYSSRYAKFKSGITLPAFDPEKSGGALMDINIYNINFLIGLFGYPKKIEYYANVEKGIDTSGVIMLDYGNFKCIAAGAKDCEAPITVSIEGDRRYITMDTPVNLMTGFKVTDVAGWGAEATTKDLNYNDPKKHRMYYEFTEFVRIQKEQDLEAADRMLEISLNTMKIQTEARKQAGIVFPVDRE